MTIRGIEAIKPKNIVVHDNSRELIWSVLDRLSVAQIPSSVLMGTIAFSRDTLSLDRAVIPTKFMAA